MLKRSKRWIALLLAVVLSASMMIMPVSASDGAEEASQPVDTQTALEEMLNPTPYEEVEEEPVMIYVIPDQTDDGAEDVTPTPAPTVEPTVEPTAEPTPVPTVEPSPALPEEGTAVDGTSGDPGDTGVTDLCLYQTYVLAYARAVATDEAAYTAVEQAVSSAATAAEIMAVTEVAAMIEARTCMSYDEWLAAEKPAADTSGITGGSDNTGDNTADAELAAYKAYIKACVTTFVDEETALSQALAAVESSETTAAVEEVSMVRALIAQRDALGYEAWVLAGKPENPADPETVTFTVTYYGDKGILSTETVEQGKSPVSVPVKDGAGKDIAGWFTATSHFADPAGEVINANTSYYVWYAPVLETTAHERYINGVGSAMFNPYGSLTRAEAVTILYNLMVTKERGPYEVSFSDVEEGDWYYEAIMTLASYRILNGYEDGGFYPEFPVSRAQFVTMLARIYGVTETECTFTDVPEGYWGESYIATGQAEGWINGRSAEIFDPDGYITRYEAVIIANRYLGRSADAEVLTSGKNILAYLDVSPTDWFYKDVMEASIGHTPSKTSGTETWTDYETEDCGLEPGLHTINGQLYYVSSETKQLVYLEAGLQEVEGNWFYAQQDGYAIHTDLDSLTLNNGFNAIEGQYFYYDAAKGEPVLLSAGVNKLGSRAYYADEEGYFINNSFYAGVVELGGKLYIAGNNCTIVTTYYDYANSADPTNPDKKDLAGMTYEYEKNMYYVKSDYSLARDEWIEYLYFGEDGKYTSGDATLDAYVYNAIYDIIDNNALTPVAKLMKVYYRIRGGEGANHVKGSGMFYYRNWGDGYIRDRYNEQEHLSWLIRCAKKMFETRLGSCYYFAGPYLYMARRLGFQAYPVVGNVWYDRAESEDARHCWCLIKWDGVWHISDVELEWGYIEGYYPDENFTSVYYNFFDQAMSSQWLSVYTNPEKTNVKYYFKDERD